VDGRGAGMLASTFLRWRVAGQTALVVLGIIAAKLPISAFSLEFISISPLFTSVLAGGVFVLGLIVSGTLADFKEAERVPAELTAALTNIHDDCAAFKQAFPDLDLGRVEDTLVRIVKAFHQDLGDPRSPPPWTRSTGSTRPSWRWTGSASRPRIPLGCAVSRGASGAASCACITCNGPSSSRPPTS
jgi:hypothetical protein